MLDFGENNASDKYLFCRKETRSFSGAITLIPQDKHSVCICSEQLFFKMVNAASAGRIKEMGWSEIELSPLAQPQGNEHSLAHAMIGTTRKACAPSPKPCSNSGESLLERGEGIFRVGWCSGLPVYLVFD